MKKLFTLLCLSLFLTDVTFAQYFQGTFAKDMSDATNLKIAFKMKPTGNINTAISYIEAAFRCPTALAPTFTIPTITSNSLVFPNLNIQRLADYVAGGFTYIKFVFNTGTIPMALYTQGAEYQIFTITTSLPSNVLMTQFQMISNLALGEYQFGVVNGAGVLIDPGTGPQLYGPGFSMVGNDHILALDMVPVTFKAFNISKNDNGVLLTWAVDNQDAVSSHFEMERSLNGLDFYKIATIPINHVSGASAAYQFTDANATAGTSAFVVYYRIKQIDLDGRFVYTDVRNIRIDGTNSRASLHPNPASRNASLSFNLDRSKKCEIRIINANGNTVQNIQFTGTAGRSQKLLDVSKLPGGTYQVIILSGGHLMETLKFIKY